MKTFKDFLNYANDSERWHSWGHVMFGFILTVVFGGCSGIWWLGIPIVTIYNIVKEGFLDHWVGKDNIKDMVEYWVGMIFGLLVLGIHKYWILRHLFPGQ